MPTSTPNRRYAAPTSLDPMGGAGCSTSWRMPNTSSTKSRAAMPSISWWSGWSADLLGLQACLETYLWRGSLGCCRAIDRRESSTNLRHNRRGDDVVD